MQQVRLESEENRLQLEATQEEAREAQASREVEAERVKRELLGRLGELEALPDRLRRAEQQLRGAEREADAHRRRSEEHDSALAEVTRKVPDLQPGGFETIAEVLVCSHGASQRGNLSCCSTCLSVLGLMETPPCSSTGGAAGSAAGDAAAEEPAAAGGEQRSQGEDTQLREVRTAGGDGRPRTEHVSFCGTVSPWDRFLSLHGGFS